MSRGKASGYTLKSTDVPTIKGMQARGDRDHDIAAWYGVNQGRIAEAKEGKYGPGLAAPGHTLPPKGPPGVKGRRLRNSIQKAIDALASASTSSVADAKKILEDAKKRYDSNEA
jgi:hypothetical protein